MTESRISGAEEPRAMSVRLDTVSFQTLTVVTVVSPLGLVMVTSFSYNDRRLKKCQRCCHHRSHYAQVPVIAIKAMSQYDNVQNVRKRSLIMQFRGLYIYFNSEHLM